MWLYSIEVIVECSFSALIAVIVTWALSCLLQSAYWLFQSEPFTHVMSRVEIEVESGQLAIRADRSPHSDVGARQELLQLLLGYSPVWLRLGLEVSERERERKRERES